MYKVNETYKVVVLGQGRVGKTSITLRYVKGQFNPNEQSTINAVYLEKVIQLTNGKTIQLALWDTAGQQKYNAIVPVYYRDAVGAIVVYEITSKESFERVKKWITQLREYAKKDIVLAICGNKSDMESQRKVDHKQAQKYAQSHGAMHFLVSAKSGSNINQMFTQYAQAIYNIKANSSIRMTQSKRKRGSILEEPISSKNHKPNNKSCC